MNPEARNLATQGASAATYLAFDAAALEASALSAIEGKPIAGRRRLIELGRRLAPPSSPHRAPPGRGIPIINTTNGGPPSVREDPGEEHYQRLPITPEIVGDPDAFAVTLHGYSMEPDFHEGDVLVFAPAAEVADGDECFVDFRTGEHTFKRVYDLGGGRLELRPLNTRRHRTQVVSTDSDTGVVRVVKLVGRYQQWNWKKRG